MADFRCGCQGNRGEATRLGSENSGVHAFVNSWQTRASIHLRKNEEGKDLINFNVDNINSENVECIINNIPFKKLIKAYEMVYLFPKNLESLNKNE